MKKVVFDIRYFAIVFLIFSALSCGDEEETDREKLERNMDLICSDIKADKNFEFLKFQTYANWFCSRVPSSAVFNLDQVSESDTSLGQNNGGVMGSDGLLVIESRIDLYTSLQLFEKLKTSFPQFSSLHQLLDSGSLDFSYESQEPLSVDQTLGVARAKFKLSSSMVQNGFATIENNWNLYAKKIGEAYAIGLDTDYDEQISVESSILKESHFIIAVIPQSDSVYVNIMAKFDTFDLGVGPAITQGLTKMIIDFLLAVNKTENQ